MTRFVKEFIETNIDNIENNKWFLLFINWYNDPHIKFPDTEEWNELIEVLQHIDKNILETTKTYREAVIITITRNNIYYIKNNQGFGAKKITLSFLLMNLFSPLGLTRQEVLQCINQAAQAEGLKYDNVGNYFTWS